MRRSSHLAHHHLATLAIVAWAALWLAAAPAAAKKNDPNVELEFVPQQAVAAASADLSSAMMAEPVRLVVRDGRRGDDPARLGSRTDDDDRRHVLRAIGDVGAHVERVIRELSADWGLALDEGAGRTLEVTLLRFEIEETNQAVGATFVAEASLEGRLGPGGHALWTGTSPGDATRYGRKYSNTNVNEVLSDALLEAYAGLLSEPGLHRAWSGAKSGAPAAGDAGGGAAGRAMSPPELLEGLRDLMAQDFSETTLRAFVRQKWLTRPLGSDDLVAWKEAGVPESVVQAALQLPVR